MRDRIRTDGFTVLQTVPLGLSGTLTLMVDRRRIELRLKACKAPVLPLSLPAHCLAPREGIEPPLTVLETAALPLYYPGIVWWGLKESNLTAATLHIMASDLQSPAENSPHNLSHTLAVYLSAPLYYVQMNECV